MTGRNWRAILTKAAFVVVILGLGALTAGVIYVTLEQHDKYFPAAQTWQRYSILISALAVVVNVGLVTAIVHAYVRQREILEDELVALQDQQELMAANRKPQLQTPYNVRFFGNSASSDEPQLQPHLTPADLGGLPDGLEAEATVEVDDNTIEITADREAPSRPRPEPSPDSVRFELTNAGGGLAKNLQLWASLEIHGTDRYVGGWVRNPLRRLDRYTAHPYADNTLESGEQAVVFEGEIKLEVNELPQEASELVQGHTYTFSEAVGHLVRNNVEDVEIVLELRYDDVFGNQYEKPFYDHRTTLSEEVDLFEFAQSESTTVRYVKQSSSERNVVRTAKQFVRTAKQELNDALQFRDDD